MAITDYTVTRHGTIAVVAVTSDAPAGALYHWFIDGAWQGVTIEPRRTFTLEPGDQARVVCIDTTDPDFDYVANAPVDYPARVTLFWPRWIGETVDHYRVERYVDAEWVLQTRVAAVRGRFWYSWLSERVDDLDVVLFQVLPVDAAGNVGDAVVGYGLSQFLRRPDAPDYTATPTGDSPPRVEFAAA